MLLDLIRQRVGDRRCPLVFKRRDTDQVLHRRITLRLGQAVRGERAQHRPQVIQRGTGGRRVHGTADGQHRRTRRAIHGVRGRRPQHLLEGPYPVGVALLLAQNPVQPGGERAAQAVRAEHQGRPSPGVPVRADPPDQQLRLDRTRPVHNHHAAGVVGGDPRRGQRLGGIAGPFAERAGEDRVEVDTGQVAHDDRGRRGWTHLSLVERTHTRRVDPRDRVLGALARPGQPRGRREQLLG